MDHAGSIWAARDIGRGAGGGGPSYGGGVRRRGREQRVEAPTASQPAPPSDHTNAPYGQMIRYVTLMF
jgi:hypothetical protein